MRCIFSLKHKVCSLTNQRLFDWFAVDCDGESDKERCPLWNSCSQSPKKENKRK